jgi:hypothetical protein
MNKLLLIVGELNVYNSMRVCVCYMIPKGFELMIVEAGNS